MKASLKFREEQKPLLRAKVPLNILGFPFQSSIVASDPKELTLNIATFFQSGPSIKVAYRPNDSGNPFSLILKTGTGSFGSPVSSSMHMSCEFNLLTRSGIGNPNPIFMLHFKPRFGDFSFKKSQSSIFDKKGRGRTRNDDVSFEVVDSPVMGSFSSDKVHIFGSDSPAVGAIANLFSGMEVAARTTFPVMNRAAVNFRWGVRVPSEIKSGGGKATPGIAFQKIPFLVMDKIGVELLNGSGDSKVAAGTDSPVNRDVVEVCLNVKRQLEVLQGENGLLRNAIENLRREIGSGGGFELGKYREFERNGGKSSDEKRNGKNSKEADKSEELKKA
ncbi:hypothetical protein TanjilG_00417 [Lupinus angustifolius]|uniref:Uncharacterized protein n=1 Tax=Lupinus angustifolius TaxID=3871 RepID=A0A1J7HCB1_LUPAN|nr:PREDICTED: uncharacterized protein LOC109349301 [Lupinus angustifolius]OIW10479.1 hypothetical protein TanjilG_00417 [Lupinus angustifolius]